MKDHPVWLILSLIFVAVVGSGAYWHWRELNLNTIARAAELRRDESAVYQRIIDLSEQYSKAVAEAPKNPGETNAKISRLNEQLKLEKLSFLQIERDLAQLENRAPTNIRLDFNAPGVPMNLRLVP